MARAVERALTLIEIIISMLVLSLVLILVLNLYPSAMAAARQGEQLFQADTIAGSLLDEYAGKPFQDLIVGLEVQVPVEYQNVTYLSQVEIFEPAGSDPEHLKGLRATVEWQLRGQTRRTVQELWVANVKR